MLVFFNSHHDLGSRAKYGLSLKVSFLTFTVMSGSCQSVCGLSDLMVARKTVPNFSSPVFVKERFGTVVSNGPTESE